MRKSSILAVIGFITVVAGIAAAVYYFVNKKGLCCFGKKDEDDDVIIVENSDDLGDFTQTVSDIPEDTAPLRETGTDAE